MTKDNKDQAGKFKQNKKSDSIVLKDYLSKEAQTMKHFWTGKESIRGSDKLNDQGKKLYFAFFLLLLVIYCLIYWNNQPYDFSAIFVSGSVFYYDPPSLKYGIFSNIFRQKGRLMNKYTDGESNLTNFYGSWGWNTEP